MFASQCQHGKKWVEYCCECAHIAAHLGAQHRGSRPDAETELRAARLRILNLEEKVQDLEQKLANSQQIALSSKQLYDELKQKMQEAACSN